MNILFEYQNEVLNTILESYRAKKKSTNNNASRFWENDYIYMFNTEII
ncbi:hypothetical protein EZS27_030518 [termite gut metagenome]|uniref:Uncharacterized protein n=1 Tax=termite gut metagenome TaxID=433724 RepID=A0A5J4QEJ7_9ZZZZ